MRNKLGKITYMAGFVFALAFTFSCNLGEGGGCMPAVLCSGGDGGKADKYKGGSCNAADYGSVDIDGQIWMAKNWGCYVPGSTCYDYNQDNCEKYGRLYDWETARDVCPTGWRLPNDEDWDKLMNAVGGSSTAGRYLKTSDWGGENKYGFAALPGGYYSETFYKVGYSAVWWSASESSSGGYYASRLLMQYNEENVDRDKRSKEFLFSVRCLQD